MSDYALSIDAGAFKMPTSDFPYYSFTPNYSFVHGGTGTKMSDCKVPLSLKALSISGKVKTVSNVSTAGTNDESYPRHVTVPVLLYIGKR